MTDTTIEAPEQAESQPKPTPPEDKRPSILFASPMSVLDITSGAALSMRTFLSGLAARGWRAVALQATLFDSSQGGEHVVEAGQQAKDKKIVRSMVLGVEHVIIKTKASARPDMTSEEEERFLACFRAELRQRRPDMIILWGGLLLEMTVMREAREAGVPVVFYLVNSGYKNKDTFRYVTTIVTDTQATADMYRERHGFTCHPIGKFIDTNLVKAPTRKPEFVTFINPSFEKGVNVFLPLAKQLALEAPEVKLLVVQSRGRWPVALKVLKYTPQDFPNVTVIGHQKDMRKVYANTRALLVPSVWYESGARVIAESLLNGIPVVASNTGGSAELVGSGGVVLELSEATREKRDVPASMEDLRPWVDAVKRIWNDPAYYAQLCAAAEEEGKRHDIQNSVDRFVAVIDPVVKQYKQAHKAALEAREAQKQQAAAAGSVQGAVKQALAKKQKQKKRPGKR